MTEFATIVKKTFISFFDDGCPTQGAALAFYTVFSLPPLLLIVVSTAGLAFAPDLVPNHIQYEFRDLIGPRAANQIGAILSAIESSKGYHGFASTLGLLAVAFAATSAFAQLQSAMNHAWNVKPDPQQSEIRSFFLKRLISFGMVLAIAFLMLVSLLVSAALAAFSELLTGLLPSKVPAELLLSLNTCLSLVFFVIIFSAMHWLLPDVEIFWKDAIMGGIATALLFSGGKILIGLYLGNSNITDVYGAAASLAVILIWTYYSSMILLLGAEFTQVWSMRHGRFAQPEPGAVKVRRQEVPTE